MWYWICRGHGNTDIVFRWKYATRNFIVARILLIKEKLQGEKIEKNDKVFIRKDRKHPDRNFPQHECPACGHLMSDEELDDTWDWAGPHCDCCGCTGLNMFAAVSGPMVSSRSGS